MLLLFSVNQLVVIRPHVFQVLLDGVIVLAHMCGIPPVTARVVVGERGGLSLERGVGRAQNRLAHVRDAMDHVPVVVFGDFVARRET